MRAPPVIYLAVLSEAAPLAVALLARRPARGARAWLLAWCALLFVMDAVTVAMAREGVPNLLLGNLLTPASVALVLWALSAWQTSELARLTCRIAIIPFVLAWLALTLALGDASSFSRAAEPLAGLVALGAAAYTLVARSGASHGDLRRHDWFWISGGMALYFGGSTAIGPLAALLIERSPALVVRAYEIKAACDTGAFLLIARGMACATT